MLGKMTESRAGAEQVPDGREHHVPESKKVLLKMRTSHKVTEVHLKGLTLMKSGIILAKDAESESNEMI